MFRRGILLPHSGTNIDNILSHFEGTVQITSVSNKVLKKLDLGRTTRKKITEVLQFPIVMNTNVWNGCYSALRREVTQKLVQGN